MTRKFILTTETTMSMIDTVIINADTPEEARKKFEKTYEKPRNGKSRVIKSMHEMIAVGEE